MVCVCVRVCVLQLQWDWEGAFSVWLDAVVAEQPSHVQDVFCCTHIGLLGINKMHALSYCIFLCTLTTSFKEWWETVLLVPLFPCYQFIQGWNSCVYFYPLEWMMEWMIQSYNCCTHHCHVAEALDGCRLSCREQSVKHGTKTASCSQLTFALAKQVALRSSKVGWWVCQID